MWTIYKYSVCAVSEHIVQNIASGNLFEYTLVLSYKYI